METKTDAELIEELARRHDELIVIRPNASNRAGSRDELKTFCKTKTPDGSYDLFEAIEMLHAAQVGLMRDCIVNNEH
ncbi:hypothetical protein LCGC14_1405810 [marine sediment metagenome]|uniref:Uncharacterized protein n=1 Tax=marine sediment metagenome TaxID=412755 RepID=A0A0F9KGP4_9ZZZZ